MPTDAVAALLRGAVEQAREAILEFSGDNVGEYLGVEFADEAAATHRFGATLPGYQGWQWAVVLAGYPGADRATVSEVVLIPGPGALLAPPWLPWEDRVRPGDLGPGDLLAPPADDLRLVPGFVATGDPAIDDVAFEVGFGRRRVLSVYGRDDAAQRWHDGDHGPDSPAARATKRACRDCGFMTPLAGALGLMFGVCCNAMSADGRVVDFGYGCGAHSDTPAPQLIGSPAYEPYDDGVLEVVEAVETVDVVETVETVETVDLADVADVADVVDVVDVAEAVDVAEVVSTSEAPSAELDAPQTLEAGEAVASAEPADG